MATFFGSLFNSIFTPGPTPVLLLATNISFGALQLLFTILLVMTYSIHFVILSLLSGGLWWAINWFAAEIRAVDREAHTNVRTQNRDREPEHAEEKSKSERRRKETRGEDGDGEHDRMDDGIVTEGQRDSGLGPRDESGGGASGQASGREVESESGTGKRNLVRNSILEGSRQARGEEEEEEEEEEDEEQQTARPDGGIRKRRNTVDASAAAAAAAVAAGDLSTDSEWDKVSSVSGDGGDLDR